MNLLQRWTSAFALALASTGTATALTCTGASSFTDVATGDIFCTDAAWLANRGVTLGCDTGLFCPNANVSRAQMALFMQRLGTVLSPEPVRQADRDIDQTGIPTAATPASSAQVWCRTATLPAVEYPRLVQVTGWVSMFTVDGNARIAVATVYSRNAGASWFNYASTYTNAQDMIEGDLHSFALAAHITVPAGGTLEVGAYPRSLSGTSAAGMENGTCDVHLLAFSRTGTSAPFDEASGDAGARN